MPIALQENSFAWPPPPPDAVFGQSLVHSPGSDQPRPASPGRTQLSASEAVAAAAAEHPGWSQARSLPSATEIARKEVASLLAMAKGMPMPFGQLNQSITARTREALEDAQSNLKSVLERAPEFIISTMAGADLVRLRPGVSASHQSDDERTTFPHVDVQSSQSGSASSYHAARETPPRERPHSSRQFGKVHSEKAAYPRPYNAPLAPGAQRAGARSASEAVAAAAAAHPGWSQVQQITEKEPRAKLHVDAAELMPLYAPGSQDEMLALWKARCRARALPHHSPPTDLAELHANIMRGPGRAPEKQTNAEKNNKKRQQLRNQKRVENQERRINQAQPSRQTFEYKSPSPPRPFHVSDDPSIISFSASMLPDDPSIVGFADSLGGAKVNLGFLDDDVQAPFQYDTSFAQWA